MQHAHKIRKFTKLAIIFDYNNNPIDSTMLYDLVLCLLSIYRYKSVMLQCWDSLSDERPTFSEMVVILDNILTPMASYIDFNQFTLEVEEQKG